MTLVDKTLSNGEQLKFIDYHHGQNPTQDKSIWTITNAPIVEENLVEDIIINNYVIVDSNKAVGYNVLQDNETLVVLGKDKFIDKLVLSKFIKQSNIWHGYPANYMNRQADKPKDEILSALLQNNKIDRTEMKRIKRGKPL